MRAASGASGGALSKDGSFPLEVGPWAMLPFRSTSASGRKGIRLGRSIASFKSSFWGESKYV